MHTAGCFYTVLGVDSSASPQAIVKAYRRLALQHHPDKNRGANNGHFQTITQAYEVLSDPDKRRLYDMYGPSLRPEVGEILARLAPLFFSFSVGFACGAAHKFQWIRTTSFSLGIQACSVGLGSVFFCRKPTRRKEEKREIVSLSDYLTIAVFGSLIGNIAGWGAASVLLFAVAATYLKKTSNSTQ